MFVLRTEVGVYNSNVPRPRLARVGEANRVGGKKRRQGAGRVGGRAQEFTQTKQHAKQGDKDKNPKAKAKVLPAEKRNTSVSFTPRSFSGCADTLLAICERSFRALVL